MPANVKTSSNLQKHLTRAELDARQAAEESVIPQREKINLKQPKLMAGSPAAKRYWKQVLSRMEGLNILDDLDAEALGVYCTQLARYETLGKQAAAIAEKAEDCPAEDAKTLLKLLETLNSLEGKLQALERNILQYADKLGLTPSGRARLAAKRAQNEGEVDPDAELFGC